MNDMLKLEVPTYVGHTTPGVDYVETKTPLLAYAQDGLSVVLGSHDKDSLDAPSVQIERRRGGWAIFLHPVGGGDPRGYVYFLDDGRSFLVKEDGLFTDTPRLEVINDCDEIPELDKEPQ